MDRNEFPGKPLALPALPEVVPFASPYSPLFIGVILVVILHSAVVSGSS